MSRNLFRPSLQRIVAGFSSVAIAGWSRISRLGVHERLMEERLAATAPGVPLYHDALLELKKEISRSRRLEHPLSIVVIGLAAPVEESEIRARPRLQDRSDQLHLLRRASAIREALREIDMVVYDNKCEQYIILLPATTSAQATKSVDRVKGLFAGMVERLVVGIAEFPIDGLFVEDLHEAAAGQARRVYRS